MIARRSPPPVEIGTLDKETMTRVEQTLRTTVRMALNDIPRPIRERYAGPGGVPGYHVVDEARHRIADHVVVAIINAMNVAEKPWAGPGANRYPT